MEKCNFLPGESSSFDDVDLTQGQDFRILLQNEQ